MLGSKSRANTLYDKWKGETHYCVFYQQVWWGIELISNWSQKLTAQIALLVKMLIIVSATHFPSLHVNPKFPLMGTFLLRNLLLRNLLLLTPFIDVYPPPSPNMWGIFVMYAYYPTLTTCNSVHTLYPHSQKDISPSRSLFPLPPLSPIPSL